jgi:hypothetical protein
LAATKAAPAVQQVQAHPLMQGLAVLVQAQVAQQACTSNKNSSSSRLGISRLHLL